VIETYNRAVWPVQVVTYVLALALVWIAIRPRYGGYRRVAHGLAGAALAAAWAWTGVAFHFRYFASINFLAPVYGALFVVQALLLAWTAAIRGRIVPRVQSDLFGWAGLGLVGYAIGGYPLIAEVAGEGLESARVVGLAPGPTAVFTLGVLLLAEGRTPLHLTAVPVLWSLIAGVTAWELAVVEDVALPLIGLGTLALIVWKNQRRRHR
jgi:Family of unknown function (DUF6064)